MRPKSYLCFVAVSLVCSCLADRYNDFDPRANPPKKGKVRPFKDYYLRPGTTATEILRSRGYLAEEHRIQTPDGYVLSIIRGTNPLINDGKRGLKHKDPVIFIHGSLTSATTWIGNSKGAKPQDFSKIDVLSMSLQELNELIGFYDSARTMPMLAMNFGYEVWLLNRRGFSSSDEREGHLDRSWGQLVKDIPKCFKNGNASALREILDTDIELKIPPMVMMRRIEQTEDLEERRTLASDLWTQLLGKVQPLLDLPKSLLSFGQLKRRIMHTFDANYWNFSLDEQADVDFPSVINYVLSVTGKKSVNLMTYSTGSVIALMALARHPKIANKINKSIFFEPALIAGTKSDVYSNLRPLKPLFENFVGPSPFIFSEIPLQALFQEICDTDHKQRTLCQSLFDIILGFGRGQSPITQFIAAVTLFGTSNRELVQMVQQVENDNLSMFRFPRTEDNLETYGQVEPPIYNLSKIQLANIVLYSGNADLLASRDMVSILASKLTVPYKFYLVNETGTYFNHFSILSHDDVTRLTNLPMLVELESKSDEKVNCRSIVLN